MGNSWVDLRHGTIKGEQGAYFHAKVHQEAQNNTYVYMTVNYIKHLIKNIDSTYCHN